MSRPGNRARLAATSGLLALLLVAPTSRADGPVEFNRDIRPILSENCIACHGPDKARRKAKLRLDLRADAIEHGAIVPGKPDESELLARVMAAEVEEVMPPPESTKSLTPAQKVLLRRWVAEGAKYQAHWAYEPIRRPALPAVKRGDWIKNPVDPFILAGLEAKGIGPSPEADRRTLLRRLSLDLIGLPPTPAEVAAFEADPSPEAYERAVDRLLASPHFGERMAVPWLDLARFADTVGYHGDQNANVFPYRDYVVEAFNRNVPFDRFTREQLAGDLLPEATPEQLVASGFNRLNMVTREGGAQAKEYLAKYAGDRVRTVAITWLGSTMGCAECHDHKFDPFTAKDFYRLAAFFSDVQQWGVYADYSYTPNPDLKGVGNDHPFPPEIEVESPALHRRIARLDGRMRDVLAASSARIRADEAAGRAFEDWAKGLRESLDRHPDGWATPTPSIETPSGAESPAVVQGDGSLLFSGKSKPKETVKIRLGSTPGWLASLRLEALPRDEHGGKVTRGGSPFASIQLSASIKSGESGKAIRLPFYRADADLKDDRYSNGSAIVGIKDIWRTSSTHPEAKQAAVWLLTRPLHLSDNDEIELTLTPDAAGCVRVSLSPFAFPDPGHAVVDPDLVEAIRADPAARGDAQLIRLHAAYTLGTSRDEAALAEYQRLALEKAACRDGKAMQVVTRALADPQTTRVFPRGNWQDETGEVVLPGVPGFLPQPPDPEGRRLNRLDLANWIMSAENPLTARVFANRAWKLFFGTGLAAVMEDVGAQGEWPSHPELLDWLAADFRDNGWDVKRLVKLMVMSAAYRQDSRLRPELRESDPGNRSLASQSPRRLEAEFVRDNALAIAGLLDPEVGGPGSFPYQPPGYYANIQFPDRDYVASRDDRQYRRGLYSHWQRTFLHPMLANFDAPSREECIAGRTSANTPQQALTLLNDPTFVEAARVLAGSTLSVPASTDEERVDRLFRRALARPAKEKEARSLLAFLASRRAEARARPEDARKLIHVGLAPTPAGVDPVELAAWAEVCRVVLNLHETITRY